MSLALETLISGISGVFLVMIFLLIMVKLSSKLAMYLERKQDSAESK